MSSASHFLRKALRDHSQGKPLSVKNYLPSGFKALDNMMPGWLHEGHLIVVAGRPGVGKSAFAQQIAEAIAEQQRTSILFTLEMSGYEIAERPFLDVQVFQFQNLKPKIDSLLKIYVKLRTRFPSFQSYRF